jgi:spore maturation protein CgeB
MEYLAAQGVVGHFMTDNRNQQVPYGRYSEVMNDSKMSLNFSCSVDCNQLKARVFEVMTAGAMLLESENEQTSRLFSPGKEFVPFESKEDLVEKIRFYLRHENELTAIAGRGYRATRERHGVERFWRSVMSGLNLRGGC